MALRLDLWEPIWINSKSNNCWYYLIDADVINFFVANKSKKLQKNDEKRSNQKSNVTYDDIKSD